MRLGSLCSCGINVAIALCMTEFLDVSTMFKALDKVLWCLSRANFDLKGSKEGCIASAGTFAILKNLVDGKPYQVTKSSIFEQYFLPRR